MISLFFLLFLGVDLDIEYISKKVYICAYLSIDKTDESRLSNQNVYTHLFLTPSITIDIYVENKRLETIIDDSKHFIILKAKDKKKLDRQQIVDSLERAYKYNGGMIICIYTIRKNILHTSRLFIHSFYLENLSSNQPFALSHVIKKCVMVANYKQLIIRQSSSSEHCTYFDRTIVDLLCLLFNGSY